jgi:uncharacterized membrane protein YccC
MFTVTITFVFSQLAAASVSIAGVRVTDVLVGAVIGVGAGVLAWPRGAGGELRRSASTFLDAGCDLIRETIHDLTTAQPKSPTPEQGMAIDRVMEIMVLAEASYSMYQAERHSPAESTVDWQALFVAGHHIVRGSELLRDTCVPGTMAPWRDLVDRSADRIYEACLRLGAAIRHGDDPHVEPVDIPAAPDSRVIDMQVWLAGIRDDLERIGRTPTDPELSAP